jgi:hypothetical protein
MTSPAVRLECQAPARVALPGAFEMNHASLDGMHFPAKSGRLDTGHDPRYISVTDI